MGQNFLRTTIYCITQNFRRLTNFEDAQYYGYGRTRLWHMDYSHKWKWAGSRETRYGQQKAKSRVRVGPWR